MPIHCTHIFIIASVLCYTPILNAAMFGGIEFPDGEISFADSVISYDPALCGGNVPTDPNFMDPGAAVGAPDFIALPPSPRLSIAWKRGTIGDSIYRQ